MACLPVDPLEKGQPNKIEDTNCCQGGVRSNPFLDLKVVSQGFAAYSSRLMLACLVANKAYPMLIKKKDDKSSDLVNFSENLERFI